MERITWTDERLDDAMTRIDARFDRLEARLDRLEMRMDQGFAGLRRDMHQMALAIGVGYLGLAAAVIAAVT